MIMEASDNFSLRTQTLYKDSRIIYDTNQDLRSAVHYKPMENIWLYYQIGMLRAQVISYEEAKRLVWDIELNS